MGQQSFMFDSRKVRSVSELVRDVKGVVESALRDVWVQGEISNLRRPPSGHLYFTLKDKEAQISVVCFRMQNRYLKFRPADGMDVMARGSVTVYPPRGQLQMVAELLEPLGKGALQVAFEQLKAKLAAEGLFDPEHKKRLPLLPARIGVVTSPSGAAIQDILRVLQRRNDRVHVLLFPARVQGDQAAREIAEGIRVLNQRVDVDVIIVGRGGGSLEDLWAFNEETVARAIYESSVPVISAVGHEIDFTIADFVADLRAPTPSAAAEIVVAKREDLVGNVNLLRKRAEQAIRRHLQIKQDRLRILTRSRGFMDAEGRLRLFVQRLDELRIRLQNTPPLIVLPRIQRLTQLERELRLRMDFFLKSRQQILASKTRQLDAYSPLQVLERGYAIVTKGDGQVVRDPGQVSPREVVQVRVSRGSFRARKEVDDGV